MQFNMVQKDKEKIDLLIEKESELQYQKAQEQYIYPKGVVNVDDYNNYLHFSDKWKNHIQRFYKLKNSSKELDLAQSPEKINKVIESLKLSKEEIDLINKINNEIYFLVQKSILFKKRAFGNNSVLLTEKGFIPDELSGCSPLIIELAGRFYKAEEIHQVLCEDMEVTSVSVSQIKNVIKENITKIKELQENFKKDYSDIRLGYKRSRLEELQYIYNNRKSIYSKSNSREDEKQLMTLIESIKKEIQGDLVINGNINLQIEEKANFFIQKEMLKNLNISMYVLARIAGKMNVNPLLILSRLAHSRYAQFTGFSENGQSPTAISDEIPYASNITYNWGKIKEQNAIVLEEDEKLAKLPPPPSEPRILSLKDKLLQKLNEAKKPLEKGKDNIIGETNS